MSDGLTPPVEPGPAQEHLTVIVLSAISRESSSCHVLARIVADMVAAEPGVVVDFAHPSEVGVPVNDGNVADDHPAATAWQARVADGALPHLGVARVPQRDDRGDEEHVRLPRQGADVAATSSGSSRWRAGGWPR